MAGSVGVGRVGARSRGMARDPRFRRRSPDEISEGLAAVRRLLLLLMLATVLMVACQSAATPTPTTAPKPAASPAAGASPVVRASPSPVAAGAGAAAASRGTWATIRDAVSSDTTLVTIGVVLSIGVIVAWFMSNRAEATPNDDQRAEIRRFVNDHFAKYVARGLAAEGVGAVKISEDKAWRKVYLQHLRLHNELYAFRKDVATSIFNAEIDAAVARELEAARQAGLTANPAVAGS